MHTVSLYGDTLTLTGAAVTAVAMAKAMRAENFMIVECKGVGLKLELRW